MSIQRLLLAAGEAEARRSQQQLPRSTLIISEAGEHSAGAKSAILTRFSYPGSRNDRDVIKAAICRAFFKGGGFGSMPAQRPNPERVPWQRTWEDWVKADEEFRQMSDDQDWAFRRR